jgi:cytidine deaminase
MTSKIDDKILKKAFALTKKVRARAYAPYSNFQVGAVVITKSNAFFAGHNIENASFGGTVCAERVAIWNWASNNRRDPIKEIVLVTSPLATPCGLCLQVMSEFLSAKTLIHLSTPDGIKKSFYFDQLLPQRFDPASLKNNPKN